MSSAVSGLKSMQTAMDVIGNNIANVNTVGFKKSRVVFADSLYQAMQGASAPTDTTGGTNPMAVGLGTGVAAIQQISTVAPASSTSSITDMAIDGDGYFILQNAKGETCYSRAGNFTFDTDGNLVNSDGYLVMGWVADDEGTLDTSISNMRKVNIADFSTTPPRATTSAEFVSGNLDSTTDTCTAYDGTTNQPTEGTYEITQKEVYDSLGNKLTVYYRFTKVGADQWECDVTLDPANFELGNTISPVTVAANTTPSNSLPADVLRFEDINFDTSGNLLTTAGNAQALNFTIERTADGAEDITVAFDLTSLTQYNSSTDISDMKQDGYTSGDLTSISVGTDGIITGTFNNGTSKALAQVALATFQNPAGLIQTGSSLYLASRNSGDPQIGTPGSSGRGAILPSSLENSNVDLSEEFTEMITTQRGFQANSRVITTSDSMLEELVNLKR